MGWGWVTGAAIAFAIGGATTAAGAAEIRLAQQYSMGYLQFNVMKRDKLIEKYATQRGLKDFQVSWQRFNGPAAMNDALLSNSTDIVAGGVPGLITLWDKTQGSSLEIKGICALSSQPFLLNTANPDVKSIKDFSERDRIAVPSIKVSVQAVVLQMAVAAAFGEANYAKLDPLTVSMSPPDATIAMLSGTMMMPRITMVVMTSTSVKPRSDARASRERATSRSRALRIDPRITTLPRCSA